MKQGFGEYTNFPKVVLYQGEYFAGRRHGKGTLTLKDGSIYTGEFHQGKKHGFGTIQWPSGNFYEGEFKEGVKSGRGVMHWLSRNEKYDGEWKLDKPEGLGTHVWLEQKKAHQILRNRYQGEFLNGLRHGFGTFFYANGARYEGEWFENMKHGYACFISEDEKVSYHLFERNKSIKEIEVHTDLMTTLIEQDRIEKGILPVQDPAEKSKTVELGVQPAKKIPSNNQSKEGSLVVPLRDRQASRVKTPNMVTSKNNLD